MIDPRPMSELDINDTFAKLNSPALVGTPTTPTPTSTSNNKTIANKEYVDISIASLVNSAPEELNTLRELADALGQDANFANTVNANISKKLDASWTSSANYIKSITSTDLPSGGTLVTFTRGDDSSTSITTHDTTYSAGEGISIDANNVISANSPLPDQTNNAGKFLKTDGTTISWGSPSHYTTHLYAGAGTASNAKVDTNGGVKLTVTDNSTVRNNVTIQGDGTNTTVTADNGIITITSKDTITTVTSPTTGNSGNAVTNITANNGVLTVTKGSTFSLSNHTHNYISKPSGSKGSATKGIYIDSNGDVQEGTYTLEQNVTASSKLTDTTYTEFGPSGTNHAKGLVPDPGGTTGNTKFLREDRQWVEPYATSIIAGSSASSVSNATSTTSNTTTFINTVSNSTKKGSIQITGSGATSVTALNGKITIATSTTATESAAGLMSSTDKAKLNGISSGANNYTLPIASSTTLGGIKVGSNLSIATDGKLSATNTTYSNATTSAAGLMSSADKTKLNGIATGANNYSLPIASSTKLGGIKVGNNLSIDTDGKLNATNTTYSNATTSAAGLMSSADKTKLNGIATGANNYSLPIASSTKLGGIKVGSNLSIDTDGKLSATNTTYSASTGLSLSGTAFSLSKATTSNLGGIIVGSGLSITSGGVLSVSSSSVFVNGHLVFPNGDEFWVAT